MPSTIILLSSQYSKWEYLRTARMETFQNITYTIFFHITGWFNFVAPYAQSVEFSLQ